MNSKTQFLKRNSVRQMLRRMNPNVHVTPGFIALLDIHVESVLKRAVAGKFRKIYLDAADAELACRYPYQIISSQIGMTMVQP